MKISRLPFSVLLPLLDIAIWVVLILIPTTLTYGDYLHLASQRPGNVQIHRGDFVWTVSRNHLLAAALGTVAERRFLVVTSVDMPAMFAEAVTSLPTSWPDSWHPKSLSLESWRSLTFPLFSLPAWWLAGLGYEALVGGRVLRLGTLLTGSILFILFLVLLICAISFQSLQPDRTDNRILCSGLALWVIAFGPMPLAWWHQRRAKKRVVVTEISLESKQKS